jgi:hypothetical protein
LSLVDTSCDLVRCLTTEIKLNLIKSFMSHLPQEREREEQMCFARFFSGDENIILFPYHRIAYDITFMCLLHPRECRKKSCNFIERKKFSF